MCRWTLWAMSDPLHYSRQKEKVRERERKRICSECQKNCQALATFMTFRNKVLL